jgi:maleate cis-trans isomerase
MAFSSWRGTVGMILPTMRPGMIEEIIRILPEGISMIPLYNNIQTGTRAELEGAAALYEPKIKELADAGVDLIHPAGAPPFMVHGYKGEAEIIKRWEATYGVPMFTTARTDVDAFKALGVKRIAGITYFGDDVNGMFADYMRQAGFDVLTMSGIGVPFQKMQELAPTEIYRFARETLLKHPDAEVIYLLGAWRALSILDLLEQDFGIPAVLSVAAQSWMMQKLLHIRQPLEGRGRLLRELP